MPYNEEHAVSAIKDLLKTIYRLRAPGGCPWDREQTHATLRKFLIEETYETVEVLDQITSPESLNDIRLKKAFIEEWGDVLLQILLNAEVASETHPDISFEAIAKSLNEKMIRRHPHVFGETEVSGTDDVLKNWEQIKKEEKSKTGANAPGDSEAKTSVFDSISTGMPPIARTLKVIQKVTKVGFQWPDLKGPMEKLEEEVAELKAALAHSDLEPEEYLEKIESEIGDILFSVCNVTSFLKLDPEAALRSTLRKFESRFRFVEDRLREAGKTPETSNLEEMDQHWNEAKKAERL
jgi:tetrapyrrole methylase family protein/MazG family protein